MTKQRKKPTGRKAKAGSGKRTAAGPREQRRAAGHDDLQRALRDNAPPGGWQSLEQVNEFLAGYTEARNNTPHVALHGLTPAEASRLFSSPWVGDGPIQLDTSIENEAWRDVPAVVMGLVVLRAWDGLGIVKPNKRGTLPKAALRRVADALRAALAGSAMAAPPEEDGQWVEVADELVQVLYEAMLLDDESNGLAISELGRSLADGTHLGHLAALLFDARLRVMGGDDDSPFIHADPLSGLRQPAMVLRALHLAKGARITMGAILKGAWTPPISARQYLDEESTGQALLYLIGEYLLPLEDFGMITRVPASRDIALGDVPLGITPLFRRFVRFVP